jgi:DNA-binding CsgD family transcriptional regulator
MSEHRPNKINNPQRKAMREGRAAGASIRELAEKFGVSHRAVHYHVYDIPVDARREKRVRPPKFDRDEILLMVGQGYSQSQIARHFKASPSTINKALARMEWKAAA